MRKDQLDHRPIQSIETELELVEEAIQEGMKRASDTSVQSHEDTVFQFADRERFQVSEHRMQAVIEQIIRLKPKE